MNSSMPTWGGSAVFDGVRWQFVTGAKFYNISLTSPEYDEWHAERCAEQWIESDAQLDARLERDNVGLSAAGAHVSRSQVQVNSPPRVAGAATRPGSATASNKYFEGNSCSRGSRGGNVSLSVPP